MAYNAEPYEWFNSTVTAADTWYDPGFGLRFRYNSTSDYFEVNNNSGANIRLNLFCHYGKFSGETGGSDSTAFTASNATTYAIYPAAVTYTTQGDGEWGWMYLGKTTGSDVVDRELYYYELFLITSAAPQSSVMRFMRFKWPV